jgi:ADP-ribosylglycohydrolase
MQPLERCRGCLLGLAVGDAVGTTLEFKPPGTFHPITEMVGGGPFDLKPGQWTADTTGAIYGQLAGAFYGSEAIPEKWRGKLAKRNTIEQLAEALLPSRSK